MFLSNEQIGQKIKEARLSKGWTQSELGERLGVGASAINKWELGVVKNIKREVLQQIAIHLEMNPATLIGFETPPKRMIMIENDYSDSEVDEILNYLDFIKVRRGDKVEKSERVRRDHEVIW